MDNSAAVYDVLSNVEAWHWETYDGHKLVFHRDHGTGEVRGLHRYCLQVFSGLKSVLARITA
jgi:hypothetical protein